MITTLIRGENFDAADRFDAWCELVREMPCQHRIRTDHAADFGFTLRMALLGTAALAHTSVPSINASRTPRLIRQGDRGVYQMELCTRGRVGAEQCGREIVARAGQWVVHDSSRPHSLWSINDGHPTQAAFALTIPKSLLGLKDAQLTPLLTRPLPGDTGVGGLFSDMVARILREPEAFRPADAPRLGGVLRDLAAAMFAEALEADADVGAGADRLLPEQTHRQALGMRIQAFVLAHLGDPDLTPGSIAAAHHISVSYLHRLFRQRNGGRTVAAWIREQRLERARRDLADPDQRATAVHAIAARWGFRHAADFSRAFRRAYGMPPRDYREDTQG
jgi:AraC-like DNA-binding protein